MSRTRAAYTPEFHHQMVELVHAGRSPEALARKFEPTAQSIRNWIPPFAHDAGGGDSGLATAECKLSGCDVITTSSGWSVRSSQGRRPGSLGRRTPSHRRFPVRGRSPGRLSHCYDVPAAGPLSQGLSCVGQAAEVGVDVVEVKIRDVLALISPASAGCGWQSPPGPRRQQWPCRHHSRIRWLVPSSAAAIDTLAIRSAAPRPWWRPDHHATMTGISSADRPRFRQRSICMRFMSARTSSFSPIPPQLVLWQGDILFAVKLPSALNDLSRKPTGDRCPHAHPV
jgi:transposase